MGIALEPENIKKGAKQAAENGMSFDEFAVMISQIIISGQTADQVKSMLIKAGIDEYFDIEVT